MDSLMERNGVYSMRSSRLALATRCRRRRSYPFFFRVHPVSLYGMCVVLIALMAVLYLGNPGYAVSPNQQLQAAHTGQAALLRQNLDLVNTIAWESSPAYIAARAQQQDHILPDRP